MSAGRPLPEPPSPPAAVGVALLNLGGPWHPGGIRPFLEELFADREIIRLGPWAWTQPLLARAIVAARLAGVVENYRAIGGRSPLLAATVSQGRALERELFRRGVRARVLPAMRYARPRAADALRGLRRAGARTALALTLYPHYSSATTGSSLRDLERAAAAGGGGMRWLPPVRSFETHPRYVEALAGTVRRTLRRVSPARRDGATILFSAHGLPRRFVDEGDPYLEHIGRTREAVLERLRLPNPVRTSFQSRAGPVRWLEPRSDATVAALGREGVRALVVVPISFVSDHVETLYEIEMLLGGIARENGVEEFLRVPAVGTDPLFVAALADLVEERLRVGVPS